MPDLNDGETAEIQGSGSKPYQLKNTGGVYSCTCPAWRNQSAAIERRTCKHLRKYRGDEAETARVGSDAPARAKKDKEEGDAPPLLLAENWDSALDPTGWWLSEKLDGVRAFWDGKQLWSRLGNPFHAPDWFLKGLPDTPLDGELWLGRKKFQRAVSIVRRQDKGDQWKDIRYVLFDAPKLEKGFEDRLAFVREIVTSSRPEFALAHEHLLCQGVDHLRTELARLEAMGAEGLMMRRAGSRYESGRSSTLLKVKTFHDAEARVLKHEAGAGRHKGRLGALRVEMPDGTTFSVGTGFSDAERESPPAVGSTIVYRYQELSDGGVPRFPSYLGIRAEESPSKAAPVAKASKVQTIQAQAANSATAKPVEEAESAAARRFEFVDDKSSKFWEIAVSGTEVTVHYGRIGADGQKNVKTFADETAAQRHAEKLIEEKTEKGYEEIE